MTRWSLVACVGLLAAGGAGAQDDVVSRAMRDELARTMASLRLKQLDRPYFVSYTVSEGSSVAASAMDGSLLSTTASQPERYLNVEVRVGDYALDNTNAMALGRMGGFGVSMRDIEGSNRLPRDDDYREIRRQIWLATDAAYKQALEALAAKRAALLNRTQANPLPDFSHAEVTHTTETAPNAPVDRAAVEDLARALSRAATSPTTQSSRASVAVIRTRLRYVNSEGTDYVIDRPYAMASAGASTQATDGARLADAVEWFANRFDSLPSRDVLVGRVRAMVARLDSLRAAPVLERYNGPVLFASQAAADLFKTDFAPALIGRRRVILDNPQAEAMMNEMGGPSFADKLGGRVLPEFMRVIDDPTAKTANGIPLFGAYPVDDEGVKARPTIVVDGGVLKTLLTTRVPVEGVDHSTGNERGYGAEPSNLLVSATNGVSDSALMQQMMTLVKQRHLPYGIIVRALSSPAAGGDMEEMAMTMMQMMGEGQRMHGVLSAYRVYPDGHQEMVRGVILTDFSTTAFKDIVAASNTPVVITSVGRSDGFAGIMNFAVAAFGEMRGGPPMAPISIAVPSLLFDDISLTTGRGARPRPPISAPPT